MAKIKAFEKYSDQYDEWFDNNQFVYQRELDAIRQLLPFPSGKGLEVGVGTGKFALPFGIEIGVEPSEKMAFKAERQGVRVFRNVAESLPFADSEFDFVLMVTTICFVDDILQSFKEAFRVLKANGCIIVGFIDSESELGKAYRAKSNTSVFYKEATFFSAMEVKSYLIEAGFTNLIYKQTLISGEAQELIEDGFGKGAFVVVRGEVL